MKKQRQITGLVAALAIGTMALTDASSASADAVPPAPATVDAVTTSTSPTSNEIATSEDSNSPDCIVCGVPQKKAVKVSGPVLISKKFVRYLTGAWARSTGYSWSSSTTVSSTIDAGVGMSAAGASSNLGVSASVTKSYSITVNIAASSGKYSKLGLASIQPLLREVRQPSERQAAARGEMDLRVLVLANQGSIPRRLLPMT